jgi:hypothetical protein
MKPMSFPKRLRLARETISNLDSKKMTFIQGGERSVIDTCPLLCRTETNCVGCYTFNARECNSDPGWC